MNPREAYDLAAMNIQSCYLCGADDLKVLGCFTPEEPALWPAGPPPPGKERSYWYGLCWACSRLPDAATQVERKIQRVLQ